MDEAIAQEDVRDAEASGVGAGLLLRGEWIDAFFLGFDDGDRPAIGIQQHIVYETARRVLIVAAEIEIRGEDFFGNPMFANDVLAPALRIRKKPPARLLQQLVDRGAGLGFISEPRFHGHGCLD